VRVLTLNAGSSSLKASLIDEGRTVATANVPADGTHDRSVVAAAIDATGATKAGVDAIGHRVVHGGEDLVAPTRIDDDVIEQIQAVSALAPLHNVPALTTIESARSLIPDRPHVACFDTAFHARLPEVARRYAVPEQWRTEWGIRRFGFHGLSVEWSVRQAQDLLGRSGRELGLVVAHLGSGCSVTATAGGESVWTSMGFTPLDGLMMRTRSGAIDPGIIVHLLRRGDLSVDRLADVLEHRSGLAAVGGHGGDVRELQAAVDEGTSVPRSRLTCSPTAPPPRSRPRRHGWTASMRSCSPAASASTPGRCAPRSSVDSGSWAFPRSVPRKPVMIA
jgi:acetate kinase